MAAEAVVIWKHDQGWEALLPRWLTQMSRKLASAVDKKPQFFT